MRRHSRLFVVALAALISLGACGTPAATEPGADPTVGGGGQTAAAPEQPALPTNGKCVLITTDKATELVGSSVTASSVDLGDQEFVHVDGCTYIGSGGTSLGYAINDFTNGAFKATDIITQAKTAMAAQPNVTPFDVSGGDASIAFTATVGPKVMARIEAAKGPYTIAVNSTATDGETAKKVSTSALAILLDAVS